MNPRIGLVSLAFVGPPNIGERCNILPISQNRPDVRYIEITSKLEKFVIFTVSVILKGHIFYI